MKTRYVLTIALVAGLTGWFAGTSIADEKEMDEQEMMAKLMELGKPGAMHKHLDAFVGEWTTAGKFWFNGQEVPSTGKSTIKWIGGKRFLDVHYSGPFMGMPFEGRAYVGHDNHKKEFQQVWCDNMSSGIDVKSGKCSDDGKTINFKGVWSSPMGDFPTRHVWQSKGADSWMLTSYSMHGDKEVKEFEIVYTRKKAE